MLGYADSLMQKVALLVLSYPLLQATHSDSWLLNDSYVIYTVLQYITTLLGGTVRPHSAQQQGNELTVNGASNMDRVIKYFDLFQLRTKKLQSYKLWKEVRLSILAKEHLNDDTRAVLKAKASTINKLQK